MDLLTRLAQIRSLLPCKQLWDSLKEEQQGAYILALLNEDVDKHSTTAILSIYVRAFGGSSATSVHHDFEYERLLEIFDLAEKYAKNGAFI